MPEFLFGVVTDGDLLTDVRAGLSRRPREVPSKYFYDRRGSELFELITRLPEYYLTRAEQRLLSAWMPSLIAELRPATLVELGAGNGEKTRTILRAIHAARPTGTYIPIDISADFLDESAARLREELPWLAVAPVVADFAIECAAPPDRQRPTLFAFLGSTVGNFAPRDAVGLLRRIRCTMAPGDHLLLGADLHTKDRQRIEAAYNDASGVTADFNRNMLRVLNRELGADFDVHAFVHRAFYLTNPDRVEMHLLAGGDQTVTIPQLGTVQVPDGESIRTEICCKYDRPTLELMLAEAGLRITRWQEDRQDAYALLVAAPIA